MPILPLRVTVSDDGFLVVQSVNHRYEDVTRPFFLLFVGSENGAAWQISSEYPAYWQQYERIWSAADIGIPAGRHEIVVTARTDEGLMSNPVHIVVAV
jgi:hypothetical protein